MADVHAARDLVAGFHDVLEKAAPGAETEKALTTSHSDDHAFRGVRPFYEIAGGQELAATVWTPLKRAMPALQRRTDMLIAGRNGHRNDGAVWVVSMGNFLGDFTEPWLGITPTGKTTYLPFVSFNRVEDKRIVETVEFLDLLAVITQAGLNPYAPDQTGGHIMSPGPKTHDGIAGTPKPTNETQATYDLAAAMLNELAETYTSPTDHLARYWHPDMNWFGPTGIGASLGFPGYGRGHTGPFEEKLELVGVHDWEISIAEGDFAAFMWWPGLTMRNIGGYMGVPASDKPADMRVVDLYRRDGDKLAENWIFIDLLHFMAEQGVDLLSDMGGKP